MKTITVSKSELRTKLQENAQAHLADFEIAFKAYKDRVIEALEQKVREAKVHEPGQSAEWSVYLKAPEDHTEDYERALEMLDWELGDQVQLTEQEFQQFVQDKWAWTHQQVALNQMYTGSISPSRL